MHLMSDEQADSSVAGGEPPAGDSPLFGKYEVGKLLGCGAFAKVYHARNITTGQSVAIKVVSKRKIHKAGMTEQIKREISIMRLLRHPNVVRLFEVLASKSKIYFVMEYAKGGELFARVSKGRFTEDLSRKYFQQLITSVGYCHARGVFHRDLKLENLLLDEKLDLKVSDFGLSATVQIGGGSSSSSSSSPNLLHTLCGTPAYVAPEILAKKGYDGAKADVWSCGVVLFVLVAGYLPFNDTNLMAMYKKIYRGEFRCPKWTSPDLRRLLFRLLDSNPSTRITVDEILAHSWFRKGYNKETTTKNYHPAEESFELKSKMMKEQRSPLNAFDLISFSSGLDLSGLFDNSGVERFMSAESPEEIVKRIAQVAEVESLTVTEKKKSSGMKLEGQNGNFVMLLEIYRLTDELVVIEVREEEGNVEAGSEIWKCKLRPLLSDAVSSG